MGQNITGLHQTEGLDNMDDSDFSTPLTTRFSTYNCYAILSSRRKPRGFQARRWTRCESEVNRSSAPATNRRLKFCRGGSDSGCTDVYTGVDFHECFKFIVLGNDLRRHGVLRKTDRMEIGGEFEIDESDFYYFILKVGETPDIANSVLLYQRAKETALAAFEGDTIVDGTAAGMNLKKLNTVTSMRLFSPPTGHTNLILRCDFPITAWTRPLSIHYHDGTPDYWNHSLHEEHARPFCGCGNYLYVTPQIDWWDPEAEHEEWFRVRYCDGMKSSFCDEGWEWC
ncbi:hypothetical protein BJ508DRAFT_306297 [Ascobolus immersus RN42]|uniref:Uncharacterized protein n=1 Tax=Ascobolus immersus RN42 TaxID=1160509 RepID=A0A3N4IJ73_ASCIM|nr:hypothetical protein BJ508DRAFT_306297 [Ascobolus immersus RN42]